MKAVTRTGSAMNAVCDPSIDSVVAPIRLAMNRSASGGMALSCSDTRNQDGLVFQPASVAFSVSAAAASGRCVANMMSATSTGTSAQNVSLNPSFPMYRSGPPAAPTAGYGVGAAVVASIDGGNGCCTLAQLSPTSSPNAARYTSAVTLSSPADACVMTAPPYECPTRTTGPSIAPTAACTVAASDARLRSGFGGATAVRPALLSSWMIPAKPDASAKAPWT